MMYKQSRYIINRNVILGIIIKRFINIVNQEVEYLELANLN